MGKSSSLKTKLLQWQLTPTTTKAMTGFDGYMDLIQKAVRSSGADGKFFMIHWISWAGIFQRQPARVHK